MQRSHYEDQEERYLYLLKSPYSCNECGLRFWAVGRKMRGTIAWLLILVVLLISAVILALLIPGEMP